MTSPTGNIIDSDRLYDLAEATAQKVHRSLAQQLEYRAELGLAVEAAGITTVQQMEILAGDRRARERLTLKLGLARQEDMYLFPTALAQKTTVHFPEFSKQAALESAD
jgi:hypothetical protein